MHLAFFLDDTVFSVTVGIVSSSSISSILQLVLSSSYQRGKTRRQDSTICFSFWRSRGNEEWEFNFSCSKARGPCHRESRSDWEWCGPIVDVMPLLDPKLARPCTNLSRHKLLEVTYGVILVALHTNPLPQPIVQHHLYHFHTSQINNPFFSHSHKFLGRTIDESC